jgi:hypothetical protein
MNFLPSVLVPFLLLCLFSLLVPASSSLHRFPSHEIRCAVCEVLVDEMDLAILETDKKQAHTVQTRWRVDEKRRIPYSRTEYRLMEILEEELEGKYNNYGIYNSSSLERIRLIRRPITPEGKFGRFIGFYSSKQVHKGLKKIYKELRESYLEDILLVFHKQEEQIKEKVCINTMKVCDQRVKFDQIQEIPQFVEMERPKKEEVQEKKEEIVQGQANEVNPVESGEAQKSEDKQESTESANNAEL